MTKPPARPAIYHITHVTNLPAIVKEGQLVSDATIMARGGPAQSIGMSDIKRRRIEAIEVKCHTGTKVGDYVPFYFCPRSVMLYVISRQNNPSLAFTGGQGQVIHLQADAHEVVQHAAGARQRWAISLSNAGAYYAEFRKSTAAFSELNWAAIEAPDFRDARIKEGKQAEFLLHATFPFELVRRVGVHSDAMRIKVEKILRGSGYNPAVEVRSDWYY